MAETAAYALFTLLALIAPIPIAAVVAGFGLCDFLSDAA